MTEEQEVTPNRQTLNFKVFLIYTVPCWALSFYAFWFEDRWGFFLLSLLMSVLGAFYLQLWLAQFELESPPVADQASPEPTPLPEPDYTPYIQHIEGLQKALQEMLEKQEQGEVKIQQLEKEKNALLESKDMLESQSEDALQEYEVFRRNANEQLEHHKGMIAEQLRTIGELRDQLEKKQQYIQQLETKTRDLNYELKTLLQIAEKPVMIEPELIHDIPKRYEDRLSEHEQSVFADFVVKTQEEAHVQLKRCLDIAQRIVGASHFGGNARFRELTLDNFALDLRRLFDSLSEVNAGTVLVYSPKEDKMLFVNEKVKDLLGLTPDKFTQNFHDIIEDNLEDWQNAVRQLAFKSESKLSLCLKNRTGQDVFAECLLGIIPTGIFRNHAIGIIYPSRKEGVKARLAFI